ncbi:hypothetical protein CERZMDRAFT_85546 [Cercospora zeae-maydis SCOH1-5]|uniref:Uncharacterized protein n=1 Tax=Cercospora zeae-maydis SCOH1-5 TaxID=717836 RepID=A0A6A6FDC2_9PEZI|nr:hypothetical protein CERZMDRAFT_85546 [Cercospora zeae-maydis SCOH1-5]
MGLRGQCCACCMAPNKNRWLWRGNDQVSPVDWPVRGGCCSAPAFDAFGRGEVGGGFRGAAYVGQLAWCRDCYSTVQHPTCRYMACGGRRRADELLPYRNAWVSTGRRLGSKSIVPEGENGIERLTSFGTRATQDGSFIEWTRRCGNRGARREHRTCFVMQSSEAFGNAHPPPFSPIFRGRSGVVAWAAWFHGVARRRDCGQLERVVMVLHKAGQACNVAAPVKREALAVAVAVAVVVAVAVAVQQQQQQQQTTAVDGVHVVVYVRYM